MEELIELRHPLPEWATFREFSNATGGGATGRIDVAAFNVWPSRKGHRIAFEVKRTRSDFLRELKHPEKRAWVEELFHETYFVVSKGVCEASEIPEGWGLLVTVGEAEDKLRRKVVPRYREVQDPPYGFVMSLVRRSHEKLSRELSRTLRFEGDDITREQLEKKAIEQLSYQREILDSQVADASKLRAQLAKDHARLTAPLATLKELALKLPRWSRAKWSPGEEVTAETVRGWWKDMQVKAAESVKDRLIEARDRLAGLVQSFDQEGR